MNRWDSHRLALALFFVVATAAACDTVPVPPIPDLPAPTPGETAVPTTTPNPAPSDVSALLGVEAGTVLSGTLFSTTLGQEMPYRIYLPPGYAYTTRRYPVVYLLHGGGGSYTEWSDLNHAPLLADAMIAEGRIRPMILVMPEGDHSYFMNHVTDGQRWGDYIATDVVRYIDDRFRTLANRDNRGIGGNSMGGHGALQLSFNHPDLFGAVVANSPSLYLETHGLRPYFGSWGDYAGNDPIRLASTRGGVRQLRIWIDIGANDEWLPPALALHNALTAGGIEHSFQVNPGGFHWTTYWIEHLPEYLVNFSTAFDGGRPRLEPPATAVPPAATDWTAAPSPEAAPSPASPIPPPAAALGMPVTSSPWAAELAEDELHRAIALLIRGLRVYAALPDSPYTRRAAAGSLAGLKRLTAGRSTTLAAGVASWLPAIEEAIEKVDTGHMWSLADTIEKLKG